MALIESSISDRIRDRSEPAMRYRRQPSPRTWVPQDVGAAKSPVKHFLPMRQDTPWCGTSQPLRTRARDTIGQASRGGATSQYPKRWSPELKAPNPTSLPIAATMVESGGTATEEDRQAVIEHLAVFPPEFLEVARDVIRLGVIACRDSITDAWPELRGGTPRGWPEGVTWDSVPGTVNYTTRRVLIATSGVFGSRMPKPDGHSSFNLVGHEFMHAFNFGCQREGLEVDPRFREARRRVWARIETLPESPNPWYRLDYYRQPGTAGRQESHAESGCRWFYGDPFVRESEIFEPIAGFWRLIEHELGIKAEEP